MVEKGYVVRHLSRTRDLQARTPSYQWDLNKKTWEEDAIEGVSYIIHLAGAGVADGRWTAQRKKQILNSRVFGSELVCQMVEQAKGKIKAVVSSSAVGYYGMNRGSEIAKEDSTPGNDFLADVCVKWENSILQCASETKVSILRTGIVLSSKGGALPKMALPVRLWVGSPIGSGHQAMPWIHIDDLCTMYIYAMEQQLEGAYNATAPEPVENKVFTKVLARVLRRKTFLPNVPAFVLKLIFGEMAQVLLTGVNASSEKITSKGFVWQFTNLESALRDIYKS